MTLGDDGNRASKTEADLHQVTAKSPFGHHQQTGNGQYHTPCRAPDLCQGHL